MDDENIKQLLDELESILERDHKTVADLARDLGRDYHIVYTWLRVRRYHPSARGIMSLIRWRDANR